MCSSFYSSSLLISWSIKHNNLSIYRSVRVINLQINSSIKLINLSISASLTRLFLLSTLSTCLSSGLVHFSISLFIHPPIHLSTALPIDLPFDLFRDVISYLPALSTYLPDQSTPHLSARSSVFLITPIRSFIYAYQHAMHLHADTRIHTGVNKMHIHAYRQTYRQSVSQTK